MVEAIRRLVRGMLGYDHPLYRMGAKIVDDMATIGTQGFWTWSELRRLRTDIDGGPKVLKLRKLNYPIVIRPRSKDIPSVVSNCVREEYGQFERSFSANFIVDAGAYIGDTAAYFLSRFPNCSVVALEPNEESYAQAETNLRPYGDRVQLVRAALWDRVGVVRFGGYQTGASIGGGAAEVDSTTIPALLHRHARTCIDILKLDIEGAEREVLRSGDQGWLVKVRVLLLETHGKDIEADVFPILRRNRFICQRFRNVWYCRNRDSR